MKRGRRKIGTKCTGKFIAIVLSIIFFANAQGGEDEDPGGFGSLVNAETRRVEVRPDTTFKENQRSNDHNDPFSSFLGG